VKNQLIHQMDHFRKEINLLRGDDFHSLNVWKTKISSLKGFVKGYVEETPNVVSNI